MSNIINPFSRLGIQHQDGLNYVIQALVGSSSSSSSSSGGGSSSVTIDQIVDATVDYINTVSGTGGGALPMPIQPTGLNPVSNLELSIIIQDAMNGYINAKAGGGLNYGGRQEFFIFQLLEGIHSTPTFGIRKYIEAIEANIVASGMSSQDQNQLLMATAIGKADNDYWANIFRDDDSPVAMQWEQLIDNINFPDASLVAFIIAASMESTLFAEKHSSNSTVLQVASTNGANAIAALAASIGVVTGAIAEQWIQLPGTPNC